MSGAGVDPTERVQTLLLRGDELLASGDPESLDEALLAYEGARDAAGNPAVGSELRTVVEERLASVRERLEKRGATGG
jgi:hypothetical protein